MKNKFSNFKDFKDFKFELIDLSDVGIAELYINSTGITFSKKCIEDLGYPGHVRTFIDPENNVFAIQACKQSDYRSKTFSKPKNEQTGSVSFASGRLLRMLRSMIPNSNAECRYRIQAVLLLDGKSMIFDLSATEEMPLYTPNGARTKVAE